MKILVLFCVIVLTVSCSSDEETKVEAKKVENLIEYKDGIYTEFYPGRKKVKIRGAQDSNKIRDGKWVLLSPTGKEMSVTFFDNGLREGYTIVKYPNGIVHYVGEYLHNKQIGIWKFYS